MSRRAGAALGVLSLWALSGSGSAWAEPVYASIGQNGRMVFTNLPRAEGGRATRVDTWASGMAVTSGAVHLALVSASMSPPPRWPRGRPAAALPSDERVAIERAASEIAGRWGVDEQLVHAVIEVESNFNAHAVSAAGALGLMQLMPQTARRFGVRSAFDSIDNIQGGVRYLRFLLELFAGNVRLALAAYNAGEGAVLRSGGRIPEFSETQRYVPTVLAAWERRRRDRSAAAAAHGLATAPTASTAVAASRTQPADGAGR